MINYLTICVSTFAQLKPTDLAYIAACIDCDGSVIIRVVKQKESIGLRLVFTIQISQHSNQIKFLQYIQNLVGFGNVRPRKSSPNMADWEVSKQDQVKYLRKQLLPYLIMKNKQVSLLLDVLDVYSKLPASKNPQKSIERAEGIYNLLTKIDQFAALNNSPHRTNTGQVAFQIMQQKGFLKNKNYP